MPVDEQDDLEGSVQLGVRTGTAFSEPVLTSQAQKGSGRRTDTFLIKLHHLLSDDLNEDVSEWIRWDSGHGKYILIMNETQLVEQVCRVHFDQSTAGSFAKQMNMWGFRRARQLQRFEWARETDDEMIHHAARVWHHPQVTRQSTVAELRRVVRCKDGLARARKTKKVAVGAMDKEPARASGEAGQWRHASTSMSPSVSDDDLASTTAADDDEVDRVPFSGQSSVPGPLYSAVSQPFPVREFSPSFDMNHLPASAPPLANRPALTLSLPAPTIAAYDYHQHQQFDPSPISSSVFSPARTLCALSLSSWYSSLENPSIYGRRESCSSGGALYSANTDSPSTCESAQDFASNMGQLPLVQTIAESPYIPASLPPMQTYARQSAHLPTLFPGLAQRRQFVSTQPDYDPHSQSQGSQCTEMDVSSSQSQEAERWRPRRNLGRSIADEERSVFETGENGWALSRGPSELFDGAGWGR